MRQGHQGHQGNRRVRGRGRRVSGGLNWVYESNGPDVKIRGTASHIAEKYAALARDAQVSGDSVVAENYMQHAEHYLRFVSAMQAQQQVQSQQPSVLGTEGEKELSEPDCDAPRPRSGSRLSRGRSQENGRDVVLSQVSDFPAGKVL